MPGGKLCARCLGPYIITRVVRRGLYECKAVNGPQMKHVHADNLLRAGQDEEIESKEKGYNLRRKPIAKKHFNL